ncbi:hypothetical protein SAMN04489729_0475 [Amycolatopsis lurida]|uniref:Uncharacterized protein n=1 Tax=Amycolatopsis lurida NRRL 2430 TaxID=1460371 RepID=A0A2P2FFZ8_AMYLU|nr:hypothetical protein [Amycolatopsis lurida]KFU75645.1 hypothetical protein BB31_40510 [Amycolatopsis lurida NRRL 2430]SEB33657.1 hypothetical protein SAMN04489729_0475 [Amycolatopsis lurida]
MTALPRGGAPAEALTEVEASIEDRWRSFLAEYEVTAGTKEETDLAESVVADTSVFEWRVVDAAFDRLTCIDCGNGLGAGPVGCEKCDQANGFRFAAIETDRPATPPGTEHGLRVATAVARTRHRYGARARCGFELGLPLLLEGELPGTAQAQAYRATINKLTEEECERVTSFEEVTRLSSRRVR